jgi:uncharacterized damage-inducible protein DinB
MEHPAVDALLRLLNRAFEGDSEHSLIDNLKHVSDREWSARPTPGARSIAETVAHAATAKHVYVEHAFGSGKTAWDREFAAVCALPRDEMLTFIREAHGHLASHVASLSDDDLDTRLPVHWWGDPLPVREIIEILIVHDTYHAGEINRLRSILQGNDRWDHYPESPG